MNGAHERPPGEATDERLFSGIAAGDPAAFGAFYDRHETLFYSLALRILGDPTEAEDVVQEAAVVVWERAPLYNPAHGRPAAWAITIVRNRAIDRLRASRRRNDLLERALADSPAPGSEGIRNAAAGAEVATILQGALAGLPHEQRQAIELAFFIGLSQSEVAERLGEPLGTIKARIRRGMLAMRDALEGAL